MLFSAGKYSPLEKELCSVSYSAFILNVCLVTIPRSCPELSIHQVIKLDMQSSSPSASGSCVYDQETELKQVLKIQEICMNK